MGCTRSVREPARAWRRAARGDGANAVERYWTATPSGPNASDGPRVASDTSSGGSASTRCSASSAACGANHDGEVILDYGCGPGNDLTGFAMHTRARRIIGMDVSEASLELAARRLALHDVATGRVELVRVTDTDPRSRWPTTSVDHVNCQGVLHHTSHPERILAEFARVLRPGGTATIMVYNRNSVWLHLCTAYERMIVEGAFRGLDVEEAFARNTDGPECPISRCYRHGISSPCARAQVWRRVRRRLPVTSRAGALGARGRERSPTPARPEHRDFLRGLRFDPHGRPMSRRSPRRHRRHLPAAGSHGGRPSRPRTLIPR